MPLDERHAYAAAATWFRSVVDRVGDRWDEPALGEWDVRALVGHTARALVTVETYLAADPGEITLPRPVDYLLTIRAADHAAVAARGHGAGAALGHDPSAHLADLDVRVQEAVAGAEDDAPVATIAGGMRLVDYLPTRTFELVVHTADLAAALGVASTPPPEALATALALAAELAAAHPAGLDVLLALVGRAPLAPGFTVL